MKKAPIVHSEIRCQVCHGTCINPSHNGECGACFSTGKSIHPYDQPTNGGINMTLPEGEDITSTILWYREEIHSGERRKRPVYQWSRVNTLYVTRLALDKVGKLYDAI